MKLIIAGSRGILVPLQVIQAIVDTEDLNPKEIVSGECTDSPDQSGEEWASFAEISVKGFPADWNTHGKAAGPIRNKQMAEYGEALIAFWDGKSRGTKNMMDHMHRRKKPVYVANCTLEETDNYVETTIKYNGVVYKHQTPKSRLARSLGCSD